MMHQMIKLLSGIAVVGTLIGCGATIPDGRDVYVPDPKRPDEKFSSINEIRDPVFYIQLGEDILRPQQASTDTLPHDVIGPLELRNETLASALQFILEGYDIPLALETELANTRTVTVAGLRGPINQVVQTVCGLADLYCTYQKDILTLKEKETFTVPLPPIGDEANSAFLSGLQAITGGEAVIDNTTQTLVYDATHRTQERAIQYFERLRANTAMIVFEIQIWEVNLDDDNQMGVDWDSFTFDVGSGVGSLTRGGTPGITNSVGVGGVYTAGDFTFDGALDFLATHGAVKTISQPQITVLSGSDASLEIGTTTSYIRRVTIADDGSGGNDEAPEPADLQTGIKLEIGSAWDQSTVYGDLSIEIDNFIRFEEQSVGSIRVQLPTTSNRKLNTRVRVRPGDAIIIGGIIEERDDYSREGVGFWDFVVPTRRATQQTNSELVFMMKPRVVVFTDEPPLGHHVNANGELAKSSNSASAVQMNMDVLGAGVGQGKVNLVKPAVTQATNEVEPRAVSDLEGYVSGLVGSEMEASSNEQVEARIKADIERLERMRAQQEARDQEERAVVVADDDNDDFGVLSR